MAQKTTLRTVAQNALRPGFLSVMAEKVWRRIAEPRRLAEARESQEWCSANAQDMATFAQGRDAGLWNEAVEFDRALAQRAAPALAAIGLDLGGGADCRLLYFLVRSLRPRTVVETGVAAGYSSTAVLSGLRANGAGKLFSSDFPYFRLERPERFVGVLVDPELREGWTLFLDGDRRNLPRIRAAIDHVDLLHYDSDKSRAGRSMAMRALAGALSNRSILVMDDIQDNLYFRDFALAQTRPWRVFASTSKYVGLIGL